ncbi:MAG: hypothetical protein IKM73_08145 [Acidaminococcaceae bacterium]|nr:hypothetical protein [Acidaminococcaceae bacterium]
MKKRKQVCPDINAEMIDMFEAIAFWRDLSEYKEFRAHLASSLSFAEEARLSSLAACGDEAAREQLVAYFRELPMSLLSHYCSAPREDGADPSVLEPLFRSSGEKAVAESAKLFDPGFGVTFSFFTYWKVQKSIHACLREVYDLYSAENHANGRRSSVTGFLKDFPTFYSALLGCGFYFDAASYSIQVHEGSDGWLGRISEVTLEPVPTPSNLGCDLHDVLSTLSEKEHTIIDDVYGDLRFFIWKADQVRDLYYWLTEYRRGKEKDRQGGSKDYEERPVTETVCDPYSGD